MKLPKSRNVFVLCTGRNGSLGFARACSHFTNYTAGHETRIRELGDERLNYSASHIEVDNRLAWFLGRLEEKYGDDAVYVHLHRDPEAVAQSYNKRWDYWGGIISAYAGGIVLSREFGLDVARDMVRTIDENISLFLRGKSRSFVIDIESVEERFPVFAKEIGARGDIDAALAEFRKRHNPSREANSLRPNGTENTTFEVLGGLHAIVKHMRDIDREQKAMFRDIQKDLTDKIARRDDEVLRRKEDLARRTGELATLKENLATLEAKAAADASLSKKNIAALKLQARQVRQSREFKIGQIVEKAYRKPSRFFSLPAKISKARKTLNSIDISLPGQFAVEAFSIMSSEGLESARRYLAQFPEEKVASDLLPALQLQVAKDDSEWLTHINSWLILKGMSPIGISADGASRFQRIQGLQGLDQLKQVEGPRISVIMPAYNSEKTLLHAAHSILNQSWTNVELIIVDDCSSDQTHAVALQLAQADSRVRVLRNEVNAGPYVSKNRALQIATGEYITGHDADDWALPDRLETQFKSVQELGGDAATIGYMLRLNEDGKISNPSNMGTTSFDGLCRLASISLFVRRQVVNERLGYWDSVRFGADSEFIARARIALGSDLVESRTVTMLCLDHEASLTNHPEHGVSKSSGISKVRADYVAAWREWHGTLAGNDVYLSFPHLDRKFEAPPEMLPPPEVWQAPTGSAANGPAS